MNKCVKDNLTDMQLKSVLQKAGLDQHETEVYLGLISLKEATAGELSKKSGVPRTYTYKVLESLEHKGFVHQRESRSIRRYSITDFEAPKRYIEQQQLELYRLQQEAQSLQHQLESYAHPEAPTALAESLQDFPGEQDFWRLLHSTLSRELTIVNPPEWWGDASHSPEVKKWEEFRSKQHIWELRYSSQTPDSAESQYTEYHHAKTGSNGSTLFLVDQYQVHVTCWVPFRALRVESQEMVELQKSLLQQ